jgi:hypothetical protein
MAYLLLDSDTLIEAKNSYYAFDLCPGFWRFLEKSTRTGSFRSIHRVKLELEAGNDALAAWAKAQGSAFFLPESSGTTAAMTRVSTWVNSRSYTPGAVSTFLGGADPWLIAQALSDGHTVVSHEVKNPTQTGKVKIPDVCAALEVPCIRTFAALRQEGARFELIP